jgi:GAF domain-containing protein
LSDALNTINLTINSTLNISEIMRRVVMVAAVTLKSDLAFIALKNGDRWTISYTHGIAEDIRGISLPDEDTRMPAPMVENHLPVLVKNATAEALVFQKLMPDISISASLQVPLILKSEVNGILFLNFNKEPQLFGATSIDFSKKMAASLALALENARLYAEKSGTVV